MSSNMWDTRQAKWKGPLFPAFLALIPMAVLFWHGWILKRPVGFPLDDSWIHLAYARNLALYGELALNPGEPSTGATSLLWMALLAPGELAGIPAVAWSLVLSLLTFVCYLRVIDLLIEPYTPPHTRRLVLLVSASAGPVIFYGLSGMETLLFIALELAALCFAVGRDRWLMAGILTSLATLCRPEGVMLLIPLGVVGFARWRGGAISGRTLLQGVALASVGTVVYCGVNLLITGAPMPTSFAGRRQLAGGASSVIWSSQAVLSGLERLLPRWADFVWEHGLGRLQLPKGGGAAPWLSLGWSLLKGAWLALAGLGAIVFTLRVDRAGALMRSIFLVLLLHLLSYGLMLPDIGHAGRYLAVGVLLLPILAFQGIRCLQGGFSSELSPRLSRCPSLFIYIIPMLIAIGGAHYWGQTYSSAVHHIERVHVATARWISDNIPQGALVAAFDIGAIGYLGRHKLLDLGGLADKSVLADIRERRLEERLTTSRVEWLAIPDWWKTRTMMGRLGIAYLPAELRQEYTIDEAAFGGHWEATTNALPAIQVYQMTSPQGHASER